MIRNTSSRRCAVRPPTDPWSPPLRGGQQGLFPVDLLDGFFVGVPMTVTATLGTAGRVSARSLVPGPRPGVRVASLFVAGVHVWLQDRVTRR